jgi:hypothetical protein
MGGQKGDLDPFVICAFILFLTAIFQKVGLTAVL